MILLYLISNISTIINNANRNIFIFDIKLLNLYFHMDSIKRTLENDFLHNLDHSFIVLNSWKPQLLI